MSERRGAEASSPETCWVSELHEQYGPALFRYAYRYLRDRQQAEEVVVEVLQRAWQRPERLDPQTGSPRGWRFTVARSVLTDRWRADQRPSDARGLRREHPDRCMARRGVCPRRAGAGPAASRGHPGCGRVGGRTALRRATPPPPHRQRDRLAPRPPSRRSSKAGISNARSPNCPRSSATSWSRSTTAAARSRRHLACSAFLREGQGAGPLRAPCAAARPRTRGLTVGPPVGQDRPYCRRCAGVACGGHENADRGLQHGRR